MGLLLDSLLEHKAIISDDFVIRTWPVLMQDLLHHPFQGFWAAVADIASSVHFDFLASNRTAFKDIGDLDKQAYNMAAKTVPDFDRHLLRCAQSLEL